MKKTAATIPVRYVLQAIIVLLALTLSNALYARSEHERSLSNPYAGPASVAGSVVGAAVTRPRIDDSRRNFVLREVGIVSVLFIVGALWARRVSLARKRG